MEFISSKSSTEWMAGRLKNTVKEKTDNDYWIFYFFKINLSTSQKPSFLRRSDFNEVWKYYQRKLIQCFCFHSSRLNKKNVENRMYVIIEMQRRIRNNRIGVPWNATPNPQLFPLMSSLGKETHSSFEFGKCPESGSASPGPWIFCSCPAVKCCQNNRDQPWDSELWTRGRYARVYTLDDELSRIFSREEKKESETKMGTHSWALIHPQVLT